MGGWFKATSISTPPYGIVSNDNGDYDRTLDIDNRDAKTGAHWSAFVGGKVIGTVPVHTGKWVFSAVTYDQSTLPGTYAFYVNNGSRTTVLKGQANFDPPALRRTSRLGAIRISINPLPETRQTSFSTSGFSRSRKSPKSLLTGRRAFPKRRGGGDPGFVRMRRAWKF